MSYDNSVIEVHVWAVKVAVTFIRKGKMDNESTFVVRNRPFSKRRFSGKDA